MTTTTALTPLSLRGMRELVRPIAASASVYLGARQGRTDDAVQTAARLRRIARQLTDQGADDETIHAVVGFLARLPEEFPGYAVFARDDRIALAHPIDTVAADEAVYGMLPRVTTFLAWLQHHPAVVLAQVDRGGAELFSVAAGTEAGSRRSVVGPGDWRDGAAATAAAVGEEMDRVGARLMLVGGDSRAILLLTDYLRRAGRRCAVRHLATAHVISAGGDPLTMAAGSVAAGAVAAHVRDESKEMVERVADRTGAVEGEYAVLETLSDGAARALLLRDDSHGRGRAWFGPDVLCAGRPTRGLALRQGRLADVAVRAALLTGAEVRMLTPAEAAGIDGGIAALLRNG